MPPTKNTSTQTEEKVLSDWNVGDRISGSNNKVSKRTKQSSIATRYNGPETNDMGVNTYADLFLSLQTGTPSNIPSNSDDKVCKQKDDDAEFSLQYLCYEFDASSDSDIEETVRYVPNDDSKYIVFWWCLLPLLMLCSKFFVMQKYLKCVATSAKPYGIRVQQ